jgi:hypothetical protein
MHIVPQTKQDWLRLMVLPFKAYVVIAPLLFFISVCFPRPPRALLYEAEFMLVIGMGYCSLFLFFFAALFFIQFGRKGSVLALPCVRFGVVAALMTFLFFAGR